MNNIVESFFEALSRQIPWQEYCKVSVQHNSPTGKPCNGKFTIAFKSFEDALRAMNDPILGGAVGGGCRTCGQTGFINSSKQLIK